MGWENNPWGGGKYDVDGEIIFILDVFIGMEKGGTKIGPKYVWKSNLCCNIFKNFGKSTNPKSIIPLYSSANFSMFCA